MVTNGLYPALELSFAPAVTTLVVGGTLRQRSSSLVDVAPESIRRLHIDVAFVSGRGFSVTHGLTESDLRDAQMKRAMVAVADRAIALADHTKFGQTYVASTVLPEEIDRLIMDAGLLPEQVAQVRAAGIELELA